MKSLRYLGEYIKKFSRWVGDHAPFPPSSPSWLNYTDEQLLNSYKNKHRAELGTEIHEWASIQIILGNKIGSAREMSKSLKTFIFKKYEKNVDYRNTLLHNLRYLPADVYSTTKSFVNDSITEDMESEKEIGYSGLFWGTSDAVKFENGLLQVFDLKTGSTPAKLEQLYIYAALYCLQYNIKPFDIGIETRVYQNDEIIVDRPDPSRILDIMDNIVHKNKVLSKFEEDS